MFLILYMITISLFGLISVDYGSHPQHWMLFDRVVQQLVLQTDKGSDLDMAPLKINVKEIVQL